MESKEAIWVLLKEIKLKRGCDKWYKCVEAKNIIEKDLGQKEKQDKALKILNEYRERIKKRIESLEEYKKRVYDSRNETEYFKTIGSLEAYGKTLDVLNEVFDYEI